MKKIFSTVIISIMCLSSIVYAAISVKNNGVQYGTAESINQNNGINWSFDGFTLTINGVNWQSVNGLQISAINWTGANINSATGVNWNNIRTSFGNTSSSTNWQAFGV